MFRRGAERARSLSDGLFRTVPIHVHAAEPVEVSLVIITRFYLSRIKAKTSKRQTGMWLREHGIETLTDIAKIGDRRAQSFSLPALRILATSWSVLMQKPACVSLTKKMQ